MKIAVASIDGVSVSPHFGRSTCFIVFGTTDGKIVSREVRDNTYTPHARGECGEGQHERHQPHDQHDGHEPHGHHEDHQPHSQHEQPRPHSHAGIVQALRDCEAVLCYGMGWRAAQDLAAAGVKAFILDGERTPEDAVHAFLEGKLGESKPFCRCHE